MTKAMPFLQKAILLSYDPRPLLRGMLFSRKQMVVTGGRVWYNVTEKTSGEPPI